MTDPSVLHVLWTGNIGGAERAVYQLVREQRRRGQDVAVLFGRAEGPYAERLRAEGCPVFSLSASRGFDVRMMRRARSAMAGFDLHHFHIVEPMLFLASSSIGGKTRVFTQRAGMQSNETGAKRARRKIAGWFLRHRFHGWSGNNAYSASAVAPTYGVAQASVRTTFNGIDFELLEPKRSPSDVRGDLGLPPDGFLVGTTAFLKGWKRIDLLIEAIAEMNDPEVRGLVIGDGPDRARLEDTARSAGVWDKVKFTGLKEDVVDIVAAMDAFVLPSNEVEAFGNAVIEAMALGIPSVIFSDSPGIREHIRDRDTGFVANDVSDLAALLGELKGDAALRASVGSAGARSVREKYAVGAAVDRYQELYAEAVARQSPPSSGWRGAK